MEKYRLLNAKRGYQLIYYIIMLIAHSGIQQSIWLFVYIVCYYSFTFHIVLFAVIHIHMCE